MSVRPLDDILRETASGTDSGSESIGDAEEWADAHEEFTAEASNRPSGSVPSSTVTEPEGQESGLHPAPESRTLDTVYPEGREPEDQFTDDEIRNLVKRAEVLRLNAIYWGLTALWTMERQDALDKDELLAFVTSCWDEEAGGFGAHPRHDAHVLATLSGIQILVMHDALDRLDIPKVTSFLLSLQNPDGSFAGDRFGETDTRFLYCAVSALSLIGKLNMIDIDKTAGYIAKCRNFDGGFGAQVGAESHSGQVFPCTGALSILGKLDEVVDRETLGWWLAERQLPNGGLNGRPEKLEDVCYSFWVLSSLSMLGKLHWIDADALISFILSAQDTELGGISDRPGNMVDVFHTQFGVAGLSLLGYPGLHDIDPVYCMPADVIEKKGLRKGWVALQRRK